MAVVNQPFMLVVNLSLAGVPVPGLTNLDFSSGDLRFRKLDTTGPSPAEQSLSPVTHFNVEEIHALSGTYAFKFVGSLIPTLGPHSLLFYKPAVFDMVQGTVDSKVAEIETELAWLAGKNTVGIVGGYDDNGQATYLTIYGFDSSTDAELFADNPGAHSSLVRYTTVENYNYDVTTGRTLRFVRKAP